MKKTKTTPKATKRIQFTEYTSVLYEVNAEVDISVADFKKLKAGKINIEDIKDEYYSIDYDDGIEIDAYIDSYVYGGEVA